MNALQTVITLLANALWQISLVAVVAYASNRLLHRASARIRHLIWFVAITISVLLPVVSLTSARGEPPRQPARMRQFTDLRYMVERSLSVDFSIPSSEGLTKSYISDHPLLSLIAILYCVFVAYWVVRLALGWKSIRHTLRTVDTGEIPNRLIEMAQDCQRRLRVKSVGLLCSPTSVIPFTSGVFKPVIVFPQFLVDLPKDELRTAVAHEMAHIARCDYLLNLICEAVSVPFAFHPCVIWMKREAVKARETACDALAAGCFESPKVYAHALLNLAYELPRPRLVSGSISALGVFDGSTLEERIMQLLDETPRIKARAAALVFTFSLLLFTVVCVTGYSLAFESGHYASTQLAAGTSGNTGDQIVVVRHLTLVHSDELSADNQQFVTNEIKRHTYDRNNLSEIAERVRFAFQRRGYFKVVVQDPSFTVVGSNTDPEIIDAAVKVDIGAMYRLRGISFTGGTIFSAPELRSVFQMSEGDIFDRDKIAQGLEGLRNLYVSKGYVKFAAVPETDIDEQAHTISLVIHLDEALAGRT